MLLVYLFNLLDKKLANYGLKKVTLKIWTLGQKLFNQRVSCLMSVDLHCFLCLDKQIMYDHAYSGLQIKVVQSKSGFSLMVSWFKTALGRLGLIWGKNEVINEFLLKSLTRRKFFLYMEMIDWLIGQYISMLIQSSYFVIIWFLMSILFTV